MKMRREECSSTTDLPHLFQTIARTNMTFPVNAILMGLTFQLGSYFNTTQYSITEIAFLHTNNGSLNLQYVPGHKPHYVFPVLHTRFFSWLMPYVVMTRKHTFTLWLILISLDCWPYVLNYLSQWIFPLLSPKENAFEHQSLFSIKSRVLSPKKCVTTELHLVKRSQVTVQRTKSRWNQIQQLTWSL